ncbi:MAG: hypothetical protein GX428_04210 [Candidatus Atribacteria bacterium]|nr:hypothetical protein [Candidatus Atribacteria bacterium]
MVTRSNYPKNEVEACLSVLVEFMTLLGEYRESIVLIGGWVPYFLIERKKHEHVGSLDIDAAFDFNTISSEAYNTILKLLKKRDYQEGNQPFIFHRTIKVESGIEVTVEINLLAGEYGGTSKSHRTQKIQDVRARKARGCDLVFEHNFLNIITAKMPDQATNQLTIKIADVIPFLVMKGMALWDRYKEKDAYDIYFTISNYPGGIQTLVNMFKPVKSNRLVTEGLGKIKSKFIDIESPGPIWVVNFEEITDEEEKEIVKRDVFERVNTFLDTLQIKPFLDRQK